MWENILRSFLLSWYVSENFVHTVVRFKEPIASMEDMVAHGICGGSWNMWWLMEDVVAHGICGGSEKML